MRSETEIIKCCPFCGAHQVQVCRTNNCWITCNTCGAEADSDKTRGGAIAKWNRRCYDDVPSTIVHDDEASQ